jgi:hypothetical protein
MFVSRNFSLARTLSMPNYPEVKAPEKAGSYPATAHAGGGYGWDAVLEYRVWCHLERGDSGANWTNWENPIMYIVQTIKIDLMDYGC